MHVLITGVGGLVGSAVAAELLQRGYRVTGTGRSAQKPGYLPSNLLYECLDLSNASAVERLLKEIYPSAILHAAAMSKPNDCELHPALCYEANVAATQHILHAMPAHCYLLFMSTDFVFGHEGPYKEDDDYAPVNEYGRSKMEAERAVKCCAKNFGVVRTVLVYGKPLNPLQATFPQWVQQKLATDDTISVFTDQQRTATYLNDLTWAVCKMIEQEQQGTYHICGEEIFTPYQMAVQTAGFLRLDVSHIKPITRQEMQEAAMRPLRSTLNIEKAKADLGFRPASFSDVLPQLF